jgi:quercetin dioxygenase-like cupin family protein
MRLRGDRRTSSPWAALGKSIFLKLWIAAIISGTCVAAGIDTAVPARADRDSAAQTEPRVIAESRFVVTNASAQSDLVQFVVDFEPGAWTSLHTHGGQAIYLVLEREITLRHGGLDRPYKAAQSWTDGASQIHVAGNVGSGKARLLTNLLLPKGGLIMEGEITLRIGQDRKSYKSGDAWMAQAGTVVTKQALPRSRCRITPQTGRVRSANGVCAAGGNQRPGYP